ncbi:hypothetical protein NK913_23930, partial [Salmonella enterica subsp. enterica serovar Typhimurium]|uniref:hypothetical protein n=1 Tax=Salmonella enterica TaxID=28901 RepID=UPI0020A24DE2
PVFSQDAALTPVKDDWRIGGLDQFTFYFMLGIVVLELVVLALMFYQFNFLVRNVAYNPSSAPKKESKIIAALVDSVAVEEEETILLD